MSNRGLKSQKQDPPRQTHAGLSMEPLIHERPRLMEGDYERARVSEYVRGKDLQEQIHQMWSAKQRPDIHVCLGHDLRESLIFP